MAGRRKLEHRNPGRANNGFTLVELMIGLLVLSVLLTVGAPAFSNLIKDNRMLSQVYALRATLNTARSEALARRSFVSLCRSADGENCLSGPGEWLQGYIAFVDVNGDGVADDPNAVNGDEVIVANVNDTNMTKFSYSRDRVRFDSRGYALNFDGTFTLCDDRGGEEARGLTVTSGGMIRAAFNDPNDPGANELENCN